MATMPSRKDGCAAVLASILPQLDWLYVFFDRHDAIPNAFVGHAPAPTMRQRA
jgi:hypothetical protein